MARRLSRCAVSVSNPSPMSAVAMWTFRAVTPVNVRTNSLPTAIVGDGTPLATPLGDLLPARIPSVLNLITRRLFTNRYDVHPSFLKLLQLLPVVLQLGIRKVK